MGDRKPTTEPDANTEQRILRAARSVFIRRGTAGARMQEIAEEAGVNQALLHYYFRTKDRLAAAVFREAAARLIPLVRGLLASDATIEAKVEQFVHLYIDTVREHPFIPGYIVAELHHHPERVTAIMADAAGTPAKETARESLEVLGAQLRERAAEGTMRPIAPEHFVVNLMGLVAMPFLVRPILPVLIGQDAKVFDRFLEERRRELPGFILNALRP